MKFRTLILSPWVIVILSLQAHAVSFEVRDRAGKVLASGATQADLAQSVGVYTETVFNSLQKQGKLKWEGSSAGVTSINDVGGDYSVISRDEAKVYGWCYQVNKIVPADKLADQYFFSSNHDRLTWFYGYAHYLHHEWVAICVPEDEPTLP